MGLGSARVVSLARARELAGEARKHIAEGRNPIDARARERAAANTEPEPAMTFGKFAEDYIASVEEGWRNPKHRQQWRNCLRDHAAPLKDKPIEEVNTTDVLAVLQPIWLTLPETASRVRGRIEKILSAAKARGLRSQDSINPAQWRGHLDVLLPKRARLSRGHHAAMPYAALPVFMKRLASRPATAARALEFLILNASRTGEVLGARWREIDGNMWTVPADRMKAGVAHNVTLAPAAIAILEAIGRGSPDDYVFAGVAPNKPLSNMALAMLLRRMGRGEFTVHGFRSAFKDWATNCTEVAEEISEEVLAHIVGSEVRRAYRRGEALDRRRKLMEAWAKYLGTQSALAVVQDKAA